MNKEDINNVVIYDKLNIVISTMNRKFDEIDERFEKVDERFEKIDERFEKIDERFDKIDERFEKIDEQISDLKDGQEKLCTRVTNLELLYENEIKRDIQLIAEGHSIIIRKLDELLRVKDDHEYTKIRLDVLESRVNRLEKEVIS